MDARRITERYFVSPQLDPADMPEVAAAGFRAVICNRPDEEVPATHRAETMRKAAEDAGLEFHVLPLTHQTLTPDTVRRQRAIADAADGRVLAYCASGTRSTFAWALGQAGDMTAADILSAARAGGYDLTPIGPALEAAEGKRS